MILIKNKKPIIKITDNFAQYLEAHSRHFQLPLDYEDLLRFQDSLPVYDKDDEPTLWETVIYPTQDQIILEKALIEIYVTLLAGGDKSIIEHLSIDRIDYCAFANSRPFRIRVINKFNDNRDHFYVKKADASRIYGLEFEGLLSPNRVNYMVDHSTLIEEHIIGIPGDHFIEHNLSQKTVNPVRLCKEFVKFNERCFTSLIGDMRSYNYVVTVTPDVEEDQYRVRPIDFDQFCHEGKVQVYLPQFFPENQKIVQLCMDLLNPETVRQYQREERNIINRRFLYSKQQVKSLVRCMSKDKLAADENILQLRTELAEFHKTKSFLKCKNMGEIIKENMITLLNL
ncbi:hypothetical protein PQO03_03130 [Lentisphaera profundi]|uniref:Uncharacterized protein n=1 Tax=Lentisphaera profundi TaxID=1658616 RepID=A0ABY7VUJ6_9BACT|nr:hypothetical protein [Lentisphaera profundi]WDE96953.1 hypothetical protein PQO03_03130 [Lentisphaera profundi]